DQRIADLIREAALRAGVEAKIATAPPSAQGVAGQGDRPNVRLTLEDAIKLVLDRNLDISVQRLNPQTFDFSMADLQATYTPPLVRNFKIENNRQQLVVTKLNQDISEIQLQATIINTLSNVRNAYWDYVFAVQSVEVAQRSVGLAEQLVKDNQTRVEVGTMAPIDVIQAQSQAATQRQNLAIAQGTMLTTELALKRLIVAGTGDP